MSIRKENRSAPLLLRYKPQIKSFLEGPTVPRSQAVEVQASVPYVAQPAEVEQPQDHPNLIPSGQVCEMAPPINPFKLMGKTADASLSEKVKGKGKGKSKGAGAGKKLKKPMTDASVPEVPLKSQPNKNPRSYHQWFMKSMSPIRENIYSPERKGEGLKLLPYELKVLLLGLKHGIPRYCSAQIQFLSGTPS